MDDQLFQDIIEIINLRHAILTEYKAVGILHQRSALVLVALAESAEIRFNAISHKLIFNFAIQIRYIINSAKYLYNLARAV